MPLFKSRTIFVSASLFFLPVMVLCAVLCLPLIACIVGAMYLIAWIVYLQLAQTHVEFNLPYNPSRVLKINLIILDLLVGWIYEIPIIVSFIYWRYWTMRNQRFQHIVKRDITYSDADPDCKLDVYSPSASPLGDKKKSPIVVFIYGGSWSSGSKYIYTPLANTLREMGYVVVVPDYRKYPRVMVDEMYADVRQAIKWAYKHASEIHGDPELLYVMGHSAGAHLVSQVVLTDLVDKASYAEAARDRTANHNSHGHNHTSSINSNNSSNSNMSSLISEKHDPSSIIKPMMMAPPHHTTSLPPPSPPLPLYNHSHHPIHGSIYDFLPQVEGLLLLAGVYNIETHLEHETSRGVEKISAMARAMGSSVDGYRANSPTELIRSSQGLFATSTEVIDFMPRILFIHGEIDTTVPKEQSAEMYNVLGEVLSPERRVEVDIRMLFYKSMSHSQCVTAFMPSCLGKDRLQKSLARDIQEFINVPVDEDE
ncbi:hypothetical protein PHYBLDRAFT_146619 [Phycomyces blakesleeanus NRRL 1555(-)]|uniref:BD-FAE-like domain-containing protein n=2 Tax=Phycomyces blakesleeanus TaxID=4837 RepID=A0A167MC49_PHYB8|nr:hypothetical protein PHYBLDRAFT_146619 [Phycomyces blakesleeanus NRRL 1555(-)]OAD72429.1 hypothetical protein PHYBLDRAFT_146619 [Phycomyces blakesleeanus NRRL 1555(-)]|eukprot:XP_018290469.1 hypothetical protein PHYBLDRAFT_146619 [Phycomyces blakesleeanus NRRL 1555(-)]